MHGNSILRLTILYAMHWIRSTCSNHLIKLLSKFYKTLLFKSSTIVEVVKSHLAPQRALDLLVVCLTTRNPRDYINKAGGECRNRTRHLGRGANQISYSLFKSLNICIYIFRFYIASCAYTSTTIYTPIDDYVSCLQPSGSATWTRSLFYYSSICQWYSYFSTNYAYYGTN